MCGTCIPVTVWLISIAVFRGISDGKESTVGYSQWRKKSVGPWDCKMEAAHKIHSQMVPRMGIGCSSGFLWTISLGSSAVLCGGDLTYLVNHVLDLVYGIPIIRSNSINLQFEAKWCKTNHCWNRSYSNCCQSLSWLSLENRHHLLSCCQTFKIINNLECINFNKYYENAPYKSTRTNRKSVTAL